VSPQQIAYEYLAASQTQECYELKLNQALQLLSADNQLVSVSDPLRTAYNNLVASALGTQAFEWLLWWQYECDYGNSPKQFTINNTDYCGVTQLQFTYLITQ
jgi:hypothetical protein